MWAENSVAEPLRGLDISDWVGFMFVRSKTINKQKLRTQTWKSDGLGTATVEFTIGIILYIK